MKQETLLMSHKERERMIVMEQVKAGAMTLAHAAQRMGLSLRQAVRIKARYLKSGPSGLVHRSRGRISNRRLSEAFREQVLALYDKEYKGFGPTLAAEKMLERNSVTVHRETLRRWLIESHRWLGRTVWRKHRRSRPRREHFGEMLQIDGSDHDWFEERAPRSCLMVVVDDATNRMKLHMDQTETTHAALWVLRKWAQAHGVPESIYADRKNVYFTQTALHEPHRRNDPKILSQFGRVAQRLGIKMIPAHSPQAKGRVERANGLLQDRLVKEFRLRNISSIEQANAMLDEFAEAMNARFARAPVHSADAHRVLGGTKREQDEMFSIEHQRRVGNDNTFSLDGQRWQILKQDGAPRPKTRVTIRIGLDGRVRCYWRHRPLRIQPVGETKSKGKGKKGSQDFPASATKVA